MSWQHSSLYWQLDLHMVSTQVVELLGYEYARIVELPMLDGRSFMSLLRVLKLFGFIRLNSANSKKRTHADATDVKLRTQPQATSMTIPKKRALNPRTTQQTH